MKWVLFFLFFLLSAAAVFHSCQKENSFDESLLYGTWSRGTLYYKYLSNHTGSSWDTSDDVSEDEAQPFTWQLVKSDLTILHRGEEFEELIVPESFTVTYLSASTLRLTNEFRDNVTFRKVRR